MKNYTHSLVNSEKAKRSLKSLFLGSTSTKPKYYEAFHKTEDIYALWLEAERFGTWLCFPCVLEEDGDPMIYISSGGKGKRMSNAAMINRWSIMMSRKELEEHFDVSELTPDNFGKIYSKYKETALLGSGESPDASHEDTDDETPEEADDNEYDEEDYDNDVAAEKPATTESGVKRAAEAADPVTTDEKKNGTEESTTEN